MAEVGAVIIVGGNIAGYTRVMTTTIALETDKGDLNWPSPWGSSCCSLPWASTWASGFCSGPAESGRESFYGIKPGSCPHLQSYNGQAVLRECSFGFDPGRTYALLGQNGSGKSTFLRIAALLEPPDTGEVRYRDNGVALPHDLPLAAGSPCCYPGSGSSTPRCSTMWPMA